MVKRFLYGKLDSNWKDVILVTVGEEEIKKKKHERPESK